MRYLHVLLSIPPGGPIWRLRILRGWPPSIMPLQDWIKSGGYFGGRRKDFFTTEDKECAESKESKEKKENRRTGRIMG